MIEFQSVWGWQPALYLFLGGLGAGTFVVSAIAYLCKPEKNKKLAFVSSCFAIVCLAVGLLLLLTELTSPLRGLLMWQSFSNFGSWMTAGAWLLFAGIIVFFVDALLLSGKVSKDGKDFTGACKGLSYVGIVLGLGIAVYTGILLMSAPGIPFWNSGLLPCLFTVSALDTGVAAVAIIMALVNKDEDSHKAARMLEICVLVFVALEALVLFLYLNGMVSGGSAVNSVATDTTVIAAQTSALTLLSGQLSTPFWIVFVGLGLVVPFAAAIAGVALPTNKIAHGISLCGAVCALIGGCALRFLIVYAGTHADYLMDAVSRLLY